VSGDPLPGRIDAVILDSYRLRPETVAAECRVPLVVMHDHGDVPTGPSLVVSAAAPPSADPRRLTGLTYAALRPAYWGLPAMTSIGPVQRVLVTTGGEETGGIGLELAVAVARKLPEASVALVRGSYAPTFEVERVELIDAPDSLAAEQLAADLVICGAGQTMLETAACGTPCIALVLAENQRSQARKLASLGAIQAVEPADVDGVVAEVLDLASDVAKRRALSDHAQRAVDGYGALRVAFHVEALLRRAA
jgi:spore coat polysaccharide biosynthesis predicted glycosyltransferase SpsG